MSENGSERQASPAEPETTAVVLPKAAASEPRPRSDWPHKPGKTTIIALSIILVSIVLLTIFALMFPRGVDPLQRESFIGDWTDGTQSISILENGEARGSDGCNGQGSKWILSEDGSEIYFEGFMGTMMACLDENDQMVNGWLGQARVAILSDEGDSLIFYGLNEERLGSMAHGAAPADPRPLVPQPDVSIDPIVPEVSEPRPLIPRPEPGPGIDGDASETNG